MRIIRGLHNLPGKIDRCVATIGNFDGVHIGHRKVVEQISKKGRHLGQPVVVVTFEPQPLEFFRPQQAPARLTRFREKICFLSTLPVDAVVVLGFDGKQAAQSPDQFISQVLVNGLSISHLVVGDDFRFGKGREGDFSLLQEAGGRHGFGVESMESFCIDGVRVSSTLVRKALEKGDLSLARKYLGRDYSICGRVVHGDKRGRMIGYPTANIKVNRKKTPIGGVFAVRMKGVKEGPVSGVANIGVRPTFTGDQTIVLETHLFDFSEEIYGRHVEVEFLEKIRDERKFDSFEQLKEQILIDTEKARMVSV